MGLQQGDWLVPLIRAFCLTRGPFGGLSFWSHKHVDRTCIVRLGFSMRRFNYRWLYIFLVFLVPTSSGAATSVKMWTWTTNNFCLSSSAQGALDCYVAYQNAQPGNNSIGFYWRSNSVVVSGTTATGWFDTKVPVNGDPSPPWSLKSGSIVITQYDTCNGVRGPCPVETDPCAVKLGGSQKFTKSGTSGDGYGSIVSGYIVAPQSGCFGGCAVNTSDQKCTGKTSGSYLCRGTAYFSGQSCSSSGTGSTVQDNTAQDPPPNPQVTVEDKPCVYSASGDTQTCTSEKSNEKEGQYCGTVNGVKTCVDSKPTKDGISIQTTVKTETKPDGSKVTTKTDVATKTNCTGAGQCSSTSTTTTTTTNTDSSGATTGTTGSCTGEACPDKNTNPDGDGDGFGDCTGTDCGDEAGEGGASDFYQPGDDTYASVIESFADSVSQIPVVAGVDNFLTFTPSGACPVYTVDTWVFSVRLDQWCTGSTIPWELIKAVILACCGFYAFRIAFT